MGASPTPALQHLFWTTGWSRRSKPADALLGAPAQGYVETFRNDVWGSVCALGSLETAVLCRQLFGGGWAKPDYRCANTTTLYNHKGCPAAPGASLEWQSSRLAHAACPEAHPMSPPVHACSNSNAGKPVWMMDVECEGTEESLLDCTYQVLGAGCHTA